MDRFVFVQMNPKTQKIKSANYFVVFSMVLLGLLMPKPTGSNYLIDFAIPQLLLHYIDPPVTLAKLPKHLEGFSN